MATTAANRKKTTGEVDTVDKTGEAKDPTFIDGVYTEYGVELRNGMKLDVEVITDRDELPASFGNLLSDGNGPAMVMAMLTVKTRRLLDLYGATMKDVKVTLPPVIERAREAAEAAEK